MPATITTATGTYVGLDVSLAATSVCVLGADGAVLFEGKVRSTAEAIAARLTGRAPGVVRVGLESGPTSAWLWRGLVALGLPAVCLEACHARAALSARTHKTDRNDARGLAELVRVGWYREARVRGRDDQVVRALLLARRKLVEARRDIENQMRGIARAFGLFADTPATGRRFLARLHQVAAEQPELAAVLGPLLAARRCGRAGPRAHGPHPGRGAPRCRRGQDDDGPGRGCDDRPRLPDHRG